MSNIRNDYFKMLQEQITYCLKASTLLGEILCNYTASSIPSQRGKLSGIKEDSNKLCQDIFSRLSTEFITPIDQEDILHIVQIIHKIVLTLDEVLLKFYIFDIIETPVYVPSISKIVDKCIKILYNVIKELKNFKKPTVLNESLVNLRQVEEKSNYYFCKAIHQLFQDENNLKRLISYSEIYKSLKNCCDLSIYAADVIERIIIKNT